MIFETVVTSVSSAGQLHVAPMGVRWRGATLLLMPFKPSTTLDNITASGHAVLNVVTDVRVFAGCVTGRRDWPSVAAQRINGRRLACALRHIELRLSEHIDDAQRPLLHMAVVFEATHAAFAGFNRAQAAVLEGAVLVSRLHLLEAQKIDQEMSYLQIAVDKTAGPDEREAWGWLQAAVQRHRAGESQRANAAT